MRNFFSVLILFLSVGSYADQEYQTKHIIGDWFTMAETTFKYYGLRITQEDTVIKLQYCELWKLQYTGVCQKALNREGTITYSASSDSLLVDEGGSSPTPSYLIKIDEKNPNTFLRNLGTQKMRYSRIR
jgi:hypothetical protein